MSYEKAERRPASCEKSAYRVGAAEFADDTRPTELAVAMRDDERLAELRYLHRRLVAAGRLDEADIVRQLLPPTKVSKKGNSST
jgi:hypothetical protein